MYFATPATAAPVPVPAPAPAPCPYGMPEEPLATGAEYRLDEGLADADLRECASQSACRVGRDLACGGGDEAPTDPEANLGHIQRSEAEEKLAHPSGDEGFDEEISELRRDLVPCP